MTEPSSVKLERKNAPYLLKRADDHAQLGEKAAEPAIRSVHSQYATCTGTVLRLSR